MMPPAVRNLLTPNNVTEAGGSLVAPSASPAEFSRFIEAETVKYERLVKAANLAVAN